MGWLRPLFSHREWTEAVLAHMTPWRKLEKMPPGQTSPAQGTWGE